jgi:hypothetical protein
VELAAVELQLWQERQTQVVAAVLVQLVEAEL